MAYLLVLTDLNAASTLSLQQAVSGTITDVNGTALGGVTVAVKGTSSATSTDENGRFSIHAERTSILVISFIGYISQQVPVNGSSSLNLIMQRDETALSEVVVTGFGDVTQKKPFAPGPRGLCAPSA